MTVFAIDLPFHGGSIGLTGMDRVEEGLNSRALQSWFTFFLSSHSVQRFELIGYSMGARLVLCLCESFLSRIDSIHLIAPDGFVSNKSYRFATRTILGRAMFKRLPNYYGLIHKLAGFSNRIGLLDPKVTKLVLDHTSGKTRSEQLYKTWTYLRYMQPDLDRLAAILALESKNVIVHLGEFDAIIPAHKVLNWRMLQEETAHAKIYQKGHRLLVEEIFNEIRIQSK